jgi:hypothetical protein
MGGDILFKIVTKNWLKTMLINVKKVDFMMPKSGCYKMIKNGGQNVTYKLSKIDPKNPQILTYFWPVDPPGEKSLKMGPKLMLENWL